MIFGLNHTLNTQQEYICKINHNITINNKVYYYIIVSSHKTHNANVTKLRYSELKDFHSKLSKQIQQFHIPIILPQFPGKKLFGSTNKSKESIKSRQIDIQDYMNIILSHDKLYALPVMKLILPTQDSKQEQTNGNKVDLSHTNEQLQPYYFEIESYQSYEEVVLYFVTVKESFSKNKWRFKARYSDLRDIHLALKDLKMKVVMPEFPKRKIFGITNDNPEEIEIRKNKLQSYLNSIFRIKEFQDSEILNFFIENSKRESMKMQKYDELKMMARLVTQQIFTQFIQQKLKAKQMGENNNPEEQEKKKEAKQQEKQEEKQTKAPRMSVLNKQGLRPIKEVQMTLEEETEGK